MSTRLSLTGLSPSLVSFPKTVLLNLLNQFRGPNPGMHASRFGLFRFRSPLLTESHVVFSSSGYLDVSVHRVPFLKLCIGLRILEVCSSGFPHSDISGSKDICSSPKLFAAYHVFHRLLVPRHPPCALTTLTVAGTIESLDSLFPHWCIALHQRALCFFHFPISLLTMKFEFLWCLDSFPFLKMNSILILVWSFQGTSVFQKQYPVSATLLVLSTMPSKNVYS